MRTNIILATVATLALSASSPVWANGDGGGGSYGGADMPSASAPRYDAAKEYQKGIDALKTNDFKTATNLVKVDWTSVWCILFCNSSVGCDDITT